MMSTMAPVRTSISGRCLQFVVGATDAILRRLYGVREFERQGDGLLRIELGRAEFDAILSDGTRIRAGDPVMELHLWNEQLVRLERADFKWAVRLRRQMFSSLRRFAAHLEADRRLEGIKAIRMRPAIANRKVVRASAQILLKIGFEPLAGAEYTLRFLENLWLWLLTWAHNPQALKGREFNRKRCEFWISRARFLALYAKGPGVAPEAERNAPSREAEAIVGNGGE